MSTKKQALTYEPRKGGRVRDEGRSSPPAPSRTDQTQEGNAMTDKPIKQPGPDHPITIETNPARIVVSIAGRVLADTRNALTLREADYPPVQYIPLDDVDRSLIQETDHTSYCPFKGTPATTASRLEASARSTPSGPIEPPTQRS